MKRFVGIIIALVMVVTIVSIILVKAENVDDKFRINGSVIREDYYSVEDDLYDWIKAGGDERHILKDVDEDGIYRGYGLLNATEFEQMTNKEFTFEAMEQYYKDCEDMGELKEFSIVTAGFKDDITIYKMDIKTGKQLGAYNNEGNWNEFNEASMYFIVVYTV